MNSLEKAFSPYHRKIKTDDLLDDEHVGIMEYIRLMDRRHKEAEKTISDPDDFEYFVEDGYDNVFVGNKDTYDKLMEALKGKYPLKNSFPTTLKGSYPAPMPMESYQYDIIMVSHQNESLWPEPCRNCPNNPVKNKFASGICNCALPSLGNTTY